MNTSMLWTLILATDLFGLAAGAWLLWGARREGGASWASDARRLVGLGAALAALTLLAGITLGGGFLVLRLWCHAIFCVLVPLAIARAVQRRGALGLALVALGLGAEGAYVWARRVEPYRLEVTRRASASPSACASPCWPTCRPTASEPSRSARSRPSTSRRWISSLSAPGAGVPLLCVAGHTHGGQVQLPFLGPLLTFSRIPRAMAGGGLFRLGDSWLCVSRGVGMERGYAPRIRFLCRPELVVLELRPAAPASPSAGTTPAASLAAPDRAASSR